MAAGSLTLTRPERKQVNRSEFRENLSAFLKQTKGYTVLKVTTPGGNEVKYVVDEKYFEELIRRLKAAIETLEIASDPKLYTRLLRESQELEQSSADALYSFEEAFAED